MGGIIVGQNIKTAILETTDLGYGENDFMRKELLTGEVPDVETNYFVVKKGCTYYAAQESKKIRIIFFTKGIGHIKSGDSSFDLSESAIFCPLMENSFVLHATTEKVEFLEILYEITKEEIQVLSSIKNKESYFKNYVACSTYKEAIKSNKTINRTLIQEGIVPRFCMGSVETIGPDAVGAHKHSMLEQFFFGLSNNYCFVRADEEEVLFEENTLLHIPLGSTHCIKVDDGHTLNYLWIDLFKGKDMSYIHESHIQDEV